MATEPTSRLEARLPASVYATLKRAAQLKGRSLTDFVVNDAYATCFLLIERITDTIAGFYTLSAHSIPVNDVPPELARTMPRYPSVPVVLIGWKGRDQAFRGTGVGSMLLYDAIQRVVKAPVGVYAICADAIDENAAAFYRKHQFQPLLSRPPALFLPMKTALALVDG